MRPKRCIVYVESDERARSQVCFVLRTRGYRVVPVASGPEALSFLYLSPNPPDLLISGLNDLAREAKNIFPGLKVLLVARTNDPAGCEDCFIPKAGYSMAELLSSARLLMMRKRGPKKAVVWPVHKSA